MITDDEQKRTEERLMSRHSQRAMLDRYVQAQSPPEKHACFNHLQYAILDNALCCMVCGKKWVPSASR